MGYESSQVVEPFAFDQLQQFGGVEPLHEVLAPTRHNCQGRDVPESSGMVDGEESRYTKPLDVPLAIRMPVVPGKAHLRQERPLRLPGRSRRVDDRARISRSTRLGR